MATTSRELQSDKAQRIVDAMRASVGGHASERRRIISPPSSSSITVLEA